MPSRLCLLVVWIFNFLLRYVYTDERLSPSGVYISSCFCLSLSFLQNFLSICFSYFVYTHVIYLSEARNATIISVVTVLTNENSALTFAVPKVFSFLAIY